MAQQPVTRRDYCTGCGRWIATWEQSPWNPRSWQHPVTRPIFGRFCKHGAWCATCWEGHEAVEHGR